jgi:hypothetical protein
VMKYDIIQYKANWNLRTDINYALARRMGYYWL